MACCGQMCPCGAAAGCSVEVEPGWRWVEAGERQLGGGRRQHETRPPGTVLVAGGAGWVVVLAMRPGHPLAHPQHPPATGPGWSLQVPGWLLWSLAPLRARSHQALVRLRLAEVCCWWLRGRGSSRWMAGCGTSQAQPRPLYTVLYTVHCTASQAAVHQRSGVRLQLVAGGGWAQTMSLLHSASSLLTSSPHFCHEPPGTGHNLIRVPCRFLHKLSFYMFK